MTLRNKTFILTVIFIFLYLLLQIIDLERFIDIDQELVKAFITAIFFFLGLYWVLDFNIKGIRFITLLGYSSYIVFIESLFLELIIFQSVGRISEKTISLLVLIIYAFNIYTLILTINILNVSYISSIPLAQAAKAANFLYTLFGSYFSFLIILRSGLNIPIKIIVYLVVTFILTLNIFWFKKESFRQLFGETFAVILIMCTLFLVLSIWPISVELATMLYTIVYYILLGLGLEERETTSAIMNLEYILLLLIAIFFLFKLTVWGINGPIM